MNIILIALIINLILSILVANEGNKKEIGDTKAFLLSFLFSPIIGMLFVINSPAKKIDEENKNTPKNSMDTMEKVVFSFFVAIIVFVLIFGFLRN